MPTYRYCVSEIPRTPEGNAKHTPCIPASIFPCPMGLRLPVVRRKRVSESRRMRTKLLVYFRVPNGVGYMSAMRGREIFRLHRAQQQHLQMPRLCSRTIQHRHLLCVVWDWHIQRRKHFISVQLLRATPPYPHHWSTRMHTVSVRKIECQPFGASCMCDL